MGSEFEMDLTRYLQTEGRRLAAERGYRRRSGSPNASASSISNATAQHQCATPENSESPPQSLSEALNRMGVAAQRRL